MGETKSKTKETRAEPARRDRLKAALKANMSKRKAQAKARAETNKGRE